jgi:DNA-binding NtrC family response regulator
MNSMMTIKILLIDDEAEVRRTVAYLLDLNGFEVMQAENGQQGIDLAELNNPDLILSDIRMEGKNGFDVFDELQNEAQTAKIPFLFMSGWADTRTWDQIKRRGLNILEKPFSCDVLIKAIMDNLWTQNGRGAITNQHTNNLVSASGAAYSHSARLSPS